MVKNLNILFYIRKDKADSLGNAPIYCRITVDGKRSELAIKREAPIERWVPGNEIIKGSYIGLYDLVCVSSLFSIQ